MSAATIDHEVVIACAGFSGIGIGIALNKASIDDYLIVEEGEVDGRGTGTPTRASRWTSPRSVPVLVREATDLVTRICTRRGTS